MHIEQQTASPALFHPATAIFSAIEPETLEPLVSVAARQHLIRLAAQFPAAVQTACYECRLAPGDERVDLALCVLPGFDGTTSLKSLCRQSPATSDAWPRTQSFLERWSRGESAALASVPFVWVAFDLEGDEVKLPAPCLGVCVDPHFFARRALRDTELGEPTADWVTEVADECHQLLIGSSLPPSVRSSLATALRVPFIRAKHLSFMLGRAPCTLKLDVELPLTELPSLLRALSWPGPIEAVASEIGRLMPWGGNLQLNLVLHPHLQQPLEVEFLTQTRNANSSNRLSLLADLVQRGLVSSSKAAVLRQIWEQPRFESNAGLEGSSIAASWYLKVRFQDAIPTEAKAYLGLMPRLFSRSARPSAPTLFA